MGFEDPFVGKLFPRLDYVLKEIKRTQAAAENQTRPTAHHPTITCKLFKAWESATNPDLPMLKAACCLAIFSFLRLTEFTAPSVTEIDPTAHLCLRDITIDSHSSPSLIRVKAKQTLFARESIGRSHASIYLVKLITIPCSQRRGAWATVPPHKLLPLTHSSLVHHLKAAQASVGLDPNLYNSHSFCIGAATRQQQPEVSTVHSSRPLADGRYCSLLRCLHNIIEVVVKLCLPSNLPQLHTDVFKFLSREFHLNYYYFKILLLVLVVWHFLSN